MELLLHLIVNLLEGVRIGIERLTPLIRVALELLHLDSIQLTMCQTKALSEFVFPIVVLELLIRQSTAEVDVVLTGSACLLAVVTAAFSSANHRQRMQIFEDVVQFLEHMSIDSRVVPRQYLADSKGSSHVQLASALILHLVQVKI